MSVSYHRLGGPRECRQDWSHHAGHQGTALGCIPPGSLYITDRVALSLFLQIKKQYGPLSKEALHKMATEDMKETLLVTAPVTAISKSHLYHVPFDIQEARELHGLEDLTDTLEAYCYTSMAAISACGCPLS